MRFFAWLPVAAIAGLVHGLSKSTQCCEVLSHVKVLEHKVFYPRSSVYSERLESIFSLSARQAPWCVVLPESTEDTSEVMKVVSKHKCPFGIRGGGHGMHALANSVERGITIDFGRMNATSYDASKSLVTVSPGTRSIQAYESLEADGVWLTAGRVAPVGVSGFILGGGISYLWAKQGWGCDNIVNFETVLANGTVINANETHNRDLWVAQRGSSGNFGLVTRYDMEAVSYADPANPRLWAGILLFDYNTTKDHWIDKFIQFGKGHGTDNNSAAVFQLNYNSTDNSRNIVSFLSNAANIPDAPILRPIAQMKNQVSNTLRSDTMASFTTENTPPGKSVYNIWFTSTFDNDARILKYTQDHHQDLVRDLRKALPKGSFFNTIMTYHAITPTVVSHANANNVLGLEERVADNKVGVLWLIWVQLNAAKDEAIAIPIVQAWHDKVVAHANRLRINWDWEYLNYAHGLQDPISKYGQENIQKLRTVSKKYDPDQVFQKLRGSGFKIPH